MDVIKKAHCLTIELYKFTKEYPSDEKYGLVLQIRRVASSISANLMEGSHRNNRGEYRHFVGISIGFAGELKYHMLLSKDLGYISEPVYYEIKQESDDICKMLTELIKSLS